MDYAYVRGRGIKEEQNSECQIKAEDILCQCQSILRNEISLSPLVSLRLKASTAHWANSSEGLQAARAAAVTMNGQLLIRARFWSS